MVHAQDQGSAPLAISIWGRDNGLLPALGTILVAAHKGSWWIHKSLQVSAAPSSSNNEDNVYVGCSSVRLFSALRWITWLSPLKGLGVEKMISIQVPCR